MRGDNVKIIEMKLAVNSHGILEIPREIVQEMGLKAGEYISVSYLSRDGSENSFHELELYGNCTQDEGEALPHTIQVPSELMAEARLSEQDDLQILCLDGAILICRDTVPNVKELEAVLEQITTANSLVSLLPEEKSEIENCLAQIIAEHEEGGGEDE